MGNGKVWGAVGVVLTLLVAVLAFGRDLFDFTIGGPKAASEQVTQPVSPSSPTIPTQTTPSASPSPATDTAGGPDDPAAVWFADGTHMDLDAGKAFPDATKDTDVSLSIGKVFPADDVLMAFQAASSATNFAGCDKSTRIKDGMIFLRDIGEDDVLCVRTDDGAWATMKVLEKTSNGLTTKDVKFEVHVYKK